MKTKCTTYEGEEFYIYQKYENLYCCPVCGFAKLDDPPYMPNGKPSYEICRGCGFQYGFDDSPLATATAVDGLKNNWDLWRLELIDDYKSDTDGLQEFIDDLNNIDIDLAYDLIPVQRITKH